MTRRWPRPWSLLLVLGPWLLAGQAAPAASSSPMLDLDASRCTLVQVLSPTLPAACQGRERTRSIVFTPPAAPAVTATLVAPAAPAPRPAAPSTPAPVPAARAYAFTTRIPFAWNSAQLAPDAHRLLDTLAEVLQEAPMADKIIRIEGHTDSAGSDAYNQRLSYRRAVAVQQYLVNAHGLSRSRLPVVGRGKADLYDPAHPLDPRNRRVEFVNLTDSAPRP
jgi:outer membrane protein OmpA-like peptidoglycan-associated protein